LKASNVEKSRCSTLSHACPISAAIEAIPEASVKLEVPLFAFPLDAPLEVSMDDHTTAFEWAEDNIEDFMFLDIPDTKAIIEAIVYAGLRLP